MRKELEQGTYYRRERAAYIVDKFLGFGLVPPTVIRVIDGEEGSVQQFIQDALTTYDIPSGKQDTIYKADLIKLWLFDCIIWNSDRHSGNFLLKDGKVVAIDHGFSFGDGHLDTWKSFFGKPIPKELAEKIEKFLSWKEGEQLLRDFLVELLPKSEVKACIARIKKLGELLKKGRIDRSDKLDFDPKIN